MKRIYSKDIVQTSVKEKVILKPQFLPADILMMLTATILCVIFIITPVLNETSVRVILSFLFILFLPGYSLIAALFPKKSDLRGIERVALSFGLSIAVTPFIGLLLNYTPFGIRLTPILLSLSAFIIFMNSIAYIRRLKVPNKDRFTVRFKHYFNSIVKVFKQESRRNKILSIVLAISIILTVFGGAYAVVVPKEGEKFTEFYILGSNGMASDYPTNLTVGETGNVTVGIINHEYSTVNYKMIIKLNKQTVDERSITLSYNQTYSEPFTFVLSSYGQNQELEFLLYRLPDENNIYRSLHLWINTD